MHDYVAQNHNGIIFDLNLLGVNACGTIGVGSDAIGEPAYESGFALYKFAKDGRLFGTLAILELRTSALSGNNNDLQTSG